MSYNVFGGTLNPAQLNSNETEFSYVFFFVTTDFENCRTAAATEWWKQAFMPVFHRHVT